MRENDFDYYQNCAAETAKYAQRDIGVPSIAYVALGLTGEAGEVAEKIKKFYRDNGDYHTTRESLKKELGDVLWYLSEAARLWGLKLSDVAAANIQKLASR